MYDNLKDIEKYLIQEFSKPIHRPLLDIAHDCGYKDSSALVRYIKKLQHAGIIRQIKKGSYKTILSDADEFSNTIQIPFYGNAQCGTGGEMLFDYPQYYLHFNTQLVKTTGNLFAVQAKGDSMLPTISSGDVVIASRSEFPEPIEPHKTYVLAHNGEVLIKKIQLFETDNSRGCLLVSHNIAFAPIPANIEDIHIAGVVTGVFKSMHV